MLARALFFGATLVAASQISLVAAGPVIEDVPVPGGTAAAAATLDIFPVPDRARFLSEAIRILYGRLDRRAADTDTLTARLRDYRVAPEDRARDDTIPVPLPATIWSDAVFRRRVEPPELTAAIL